MDQLNKFSASQEGMKNDIQEELKNNMLRIGADQEEVKNNIQGNISDIQDKIRADISAIRSGQAEFEEIITDKLDKQLKGVGTTVEQQTPKLHEEFNGEEK
jgi:hypothetical protein